MRRALAPLLFADEELPTLRRQRPPVDPAAPSISAQRKKASLVDDHGRPIHSSPPHSRPAAGTRTARSCSQFAERALNPIPNKSWGVVPQPRSNFGLVACNNSGALECGDVSRRFAFELAAKAATAVAALVCRACSTAGKFKSSANLMEVKGSEAQGVSREIVRRKRGAKARADEQERDEATRSGRAGESPRSPNPSRHRGVDHAVVRWKRSNLPRESWEAVEGLGEPRGDLKSDPAVSRGHSRSRRAPKARTVPSLEWRR